MRKSEFEEEITALGLQALAQARRLADQSFPSLLVAKRMGALTKQLKLRYTNHTPIVNFGDAATTHLITESLLAATEGNVKRAGYHRWLALKLIQGPTKPNEVAATYGIGPFKEPANTMQTKGGKARQQPSQAVRAYVLMEYQARQFPSKAQAAKELTPLALTYAMNVGFHMKATNAHNTVYRWILADSTTGLHRQKEK